MRDPAIKKREAVMCAFLALFVFQNGLERISPAFSHVDELPALLAVLYLATHPGSLRRLRHVDRGIVLALIFFAAAGLAGNVVYRYQTPRLAAIDFLTNFKFVLAVFISKQYLTESALRYRAVPKLASALSSALFGLFLFDRVFGIFPGEYRYGIRSNTLFFDHPTYLAGACVFLIGVMTLYDCRRYGWPIAFNLIMLAFTLRGKAIAGAACYVLLYIVIVRMHSRLKVWQILLVAAVAVAIAWNQIYFYYFRLAGASARSVMLSTSFRIVRDYFPIGTGFGTYASHSAAVNYSPVYTKYGFELVYELRRSAEGTFFDDHFWPIILGQTGAIGTACYLFCLYRMFRKAQRVRKADVRAYFAGLFLFMYLLIASVAEPAFNNSIAVPMACVIGFAFRLGEDAGQDRRQDTEQAVPMLPPPSA